MITLLDDKYDLAEFLTFLEDEMALNNIVDVTADEDAMIGWVDRDGGIIYLKNTTNWPNFFKRFKDFLFSRHMRLDNSSKAAFVKDTLEKHKIVQARTVSRNTMTKRYDYQRTMVKGGETVRVYQIDYNRLKKLVEINKQRSSLMAMPLEPQPQAIYEGIGLKDVTEE